jgi:hypothetical protein
MRVTMATAEAGRPGRTNEDFVGAAPTAVVLTDGAGGVVGAETVCRHGVGWYACRLGGHLLNLLSPGAAYPAAPATDRTLPALLAEAIEAVADDHRHTCDLADPRSPWATVAILRLRDGHAEYLVLGDSVLVLDRAGAPLVVTDPREVRIAEPYQAALDTAVEGSAEYQRILRDGRTAMRANRNRPGGYWVAQQDPRAAAEAVVGSLPVADLAGALLLSNGASRIVDRFGLADWAEVLTAVRTAGPDEIISRVRQAEADRKVAADDATVAHCTDLAGPASGLLRTPAGP